MTILTGAKIVNGGLRYLGDAPKIEKWSCDYNFVLT